MNLFSGMVFVGCRLVMTMKFVRGKAGYNDTFIILDIREKLQTEL